MPRCVKEGEMSDRRERREAPRDDERTGKYGGDDGALEHERTEVAPGEDTGIEGTPLGKEGDDVRSHPDRRRRR